MPTAVEHDPQPAEQEDDRITLAREADQIVNSGDEDED